MHYFLNGVLRYMYARAVYYICLLRGMVLGLEELKGLLDLDSSSCSCFIGLEGCAHCSGSMGIWFIRITRVSFTNCGLMYR